MLASRRTIMADTDSAALRREIEASDLPAGLVSLWSLGNMGFVLKGARGGPTLAFDPYLTNAIEVNQPDTEFVRAFAPPLLPEDLSADAVLVTHEHDDHLDLVTLGRALAARPNLTVVVPEALVETARGAVPRAQVIGAREGVAFDLHGARVLPLAAAHPVLERDGQGRSMRLGYLVDLAGVRVFHCGDTVLHEGLVTALAALKPDVLIAPINGGDWFRTRRGIVPNMSHRDAVELAAHVRADLLVAAHFDLFPNNRERPAFFVDYLYEAHPTQKFHLFAPGERLVYARNER
jgi:L-ascorbate metabolism protein UlaG (beta-lactamase superfamily)